MGYWYYIVDLARLGLFLTWGAISLADPRVMNLLAHKDLMGFSSDLLERSPKPLSLKHCPLPTEACAFFLTWSLALSSGLDEVYFCFATGLLCMDYGVLKSFLVGLAGLHL